MNRDGGVAYHEFIIETMKHVREEISKMRDDMSEIKADQRALATLADQIRDIQRKQSAIELAVQKEHNDISLKVKALEVRSAVYGSISGVVITLIGLAVNFLK